MNQNGFIHPQQGQVNPGALPNTQQQQQQVQNINEFPNDNFYLNFATNSRPPYELQSEAIERIEQRSIIENILEKKAKKHV